MERRYQKLPLLLSAVSLSLLTSLGLGYNNLSDSSSPHESAIRGAATAIANLDQSVFPLHEKMTLEIAEKIKRGTMNAEILTKNNQLVSCSGFLAHVDEQVAYFATVDHCLADKNGKDEEVRNLKLYRPGVDEFAINLYSGYYEFARDPVTKLAVICFYHLGVLTPDDSLPITFDYNGVGNGTPLVKYGFTSAFGTYDGGNLASSTQYGYAEINRNYAKYVVTGWQDNKMLFPGHAAEGLSGAAVMEFGNGKLSVVAVVDTQAGSVDKSCAEKNVCQQEEVYTAYSLNGLPKLMLDARSKMQWLPEEKATFLTGR